VKAGMSKEAAENYLGAIRSSLESPNMILDLRVPKSAQYQGVVLDTAVAQFLAGEISRDQAMQQIERGWDKITDDEGRDDQKAAYADSLNIQR
jgi:multiple sugar transport system substrate-binding protein